MSRRTAATIVGAMALAMLALPGCDALPGRPLPADRPLLPSEVTAFTALYGQHCAGCHGADGRLGAARPLNDPVYLALIQQDRLSRIIAQGVPASAMPAFATSAGGPLTATQIDVLVQEIARGWGRPASLPDLPLPPYAAEDAVASGSGGGDAAQGWKVYGEACASCHGPDGKGTPKGGAIVDAAYLALVSDQALRTAVIAGRIDLGMPDWRQGNSGRPLTPQQISDVVAWLVSRRQPVMGRATLSVSGDGPQQRWP